LWGIANALFIQVFDIHAQPPLVEAVSSDKGCCSHR
jgi:hypothetical protein